MNDNKKPTDLAAQCLAELKKLDPKHLLFNIEYDSSTKVMRYVIRDTENEYPVASACQHVDQILFLVMEDVANAIKEHTPKEYGRGDTFKLGSDTYILAQTHGREFALIGLSTGNRYSEPIKSAKNRHTMGEWRNLGLFGTCGEQDMFTSITLDLSNKNIVI